MAYLLNQLLTQSAARYPDNPAVWALGRSLTYSELDRKSNQLARLLRSRGIKKGDRVGLYSPKSVDVLAGMFGILKAGGVYIPMDVQQPAQRAAYLIDNCEMKAVIGSGAAIQGLQSFPVKSVEFAVVLDDVEVPGATQELAPWSSLAALPSEPVAYFQQTTTDLAYILYTSGSTGQPKGVMISHQNALTFVNWCAQTFSVRPEDRLSNHAPLHFDLSVFDVFNAIEAGASVHMVPPNVAPFPASLANFIESQGITVWYSVPSALILLILHASTQLQGLKNLRLVLFAGEIFPMKYLRRLADLLPEVDLYNLYGPTETNVCTYYRVVRTLLETQERLPIGKACENTEVFAVDENDGIAGRGQQGELYVRGPGVTSGYWGDAEKTQKTCIPNRFEPNFREYVYRTGDLVTLLDEEGNYDFQGRRDSMIKSRGYRIELGEIEAAMLSHPGVQEAIALPLPDEEVGARIKAIIAPHSKDSITTAALLQHCSLRIPKYMLPELIEFRDSLPKTSTGKIDRVRLASESVAAKN
jgi:amino acid adenylation domain-containing protein